MDGFLGPVEEANELTNSPVIVIDLLLPDTCIFKDDGHFRVEEGLVSEPVLKGIEIEYDRLEHRLIRQEGYRGTGLVSIPDDLDRSIRHTVMVRLPVDLPFPLHGCNKPLGEGVYDRHTDTVQTTGDLVCVLIELTSGVEVCQTHLHGRFGLTLRDPCGDTPTVIDDRDGTIIVDRDIDVRGKARHDLINRVVNDLVDKVMETSRICTSDVHSGPFTDSFKSFQCLDTVSVVNFAFSVFVFVSHNFPSEKLFMQRNAPIL